MKVYLVNEYSSNNCSYEDFNEGDEVIAVFSSERSAENYIMSLTKPSFKEEPDYFPKEANGAKLYAIFNPKDPDRAIVERDYISEDFDPNHRFVRMLFLGYPETYEACNFLYSIIPMEVQE